MSRARHRCGGGPLVLRCAGCSEAVLGPEDQEADGAAADAVDDALGQVDVETVLPPGDPPGSVDTPPEFSQVTEQTGRPPVLAPGILGTVFHAKQLPTYVWVGWQRREPSRPVAWKPSSGLQGSFCVAGQSTGARHQHRSRDHNLWVAGYDGGHATERIGTPRNASERTRGPRK